jgi:hypothetical protein
MSHKELNKDLKRFKFEDYKKNIKTHCVKCGEPIPRVPKKPRKSWNLKWEIWKNYLLWGNYCYKCNRRYNENWKTKEAHKFYKEVKNIMGII